MSPSYLASGTLKAVLSLCLAFSTITPTLSAPTQAESSQWIPRSLKSLFEPRDAPTCSGTGVLLTNSGATKSFSFWTNNADYSRSKLKDITLNSGETQFVSLASGWTGTVQRGEALPATWVEMNMVGMAYGDVSLQQGCDGAATLASTTSDDSQGFTDNINEDPNVPAAALFNPATQGTPCYSGQCTTSATNVLDTTNGNYWGGPNAASTNYMMSKLGGETAALQKAFIGTADSNTTPQVTTSNNCFAVTFY